MRIVQPIVLAVMVAACTATTGVPESRTDRTTVSLGDGAGFNNMQITREAAISSGTVAAPLDQVWAALSPVYAQFELAVNEVAPSTRTIASSGQRVRRVAGKSIATFLSCPGPYGNAAANSDVYLTVRTQVLPGGDPTSALVRTELQATARSGTGANSMINCSTNGTLERQLLEAVAARATAG